MLLRFGVANHLSIFESQELSLSASSLKDYEDGLIACEAVPSGSIVPAVVIYGANASGKTNLLNALSRMQKMVLLSQTKGEPGQGVQRSVFRLDPECSQAPSHFDVDFIIDNVRYHYGFETTNERFTSEWLYAFPKSHRRKMFERSCEGFSFGRWLSGQNNSIAKLTRPNSLFLSAAAQNSHEQLSRIYQYFRSINFVGPSAVHGIEASTRFTEHGLDSRVIDFLKSMDTGVVGFRKKETEMSDKARAIDRDIKAVMEKHGYPVPTDSDEDDKHVAIELAHRGRGGESVYFDLDLESAGTRRLLIVLSVVYEALDNGTPLCIDELDANLHTQAGNAVLELFCSPLTNPNGAQLIATTHDTNLMRSEVLRRDQLWFAEKNPEGATELYPLTDIQTRKGDNMELGYMQGRYGGVPGNRPVPTSFEVA